jgi:hypothetical protein
MESGLLLRARESNNSAARARPRNVNHFRSPPRWRDPRETGSTGHFERGSSADAQFSSRMLRNGAGKSTA